MATSTSSSASTPLFMLFYLITGLQFLTSISAKSETYIVHMDLSVMPKVISGHHSWYATTLSSLTENTQFSSNTSPNLIYTYTNAINGFSASLSAFEVEKLKKSPGFISLIRDLPVTLDTTHTSQFLNLNSYSGAWPESSYGKDVIIGVVDTGIWPESESYNDDGFTEIPSRWKGECVSGTAFNSSMCNKKLIGAKFFNKGVLSNNPGETITMNSTRDTDGHGTHTSSTAAGNYVEGASYFGYATGTAVGMAPKAHVAMYKTSWEIGSYTSDILAAIDQAIEDGVDVLSMSFGEDGVPLYNDPIAIASFAAMEKGIFVAASAGNDGPSYGVLHNGAPWIVTVAAGTIDREFSGIITLSNGVSVVGSSLYPLNSSNINQVPLLFMNNCSNSEELLKVGKKIVVCLDIEGTEGLLSTQVRYVNNGDASGGLFISNASTSSFIRTSFPAVFLTLEEGRKILDLIKMSSNPRASLRFQKTMVGKTKIAPRVAAYSSSGPARSCPSVLKPDIMGPGTLVLAAWPNSTFAATAGSRVLYNEFNIISGTSMSCPHVAGIGALLKGIHPTWSPAAIRSAMMTTADSLDNTNSPIKDIGYSFEPATPLAMGAGHINPNRAIDPGLIYDANAKDYVNLLCSMNFTKGQIKTIARSSSYNCLNRPSSDLNYPSFIAFFNENDLSNDTKVVREFTRTVTNVGEGKATYTAKLAGMDGFQMNVKPTTLVFRKKYEKQIYKLSIKGPKLMKEVVAHGSLSWVEVGGSKHVVRSPIVATSLILESLDSISLDEVGGSKHVVRSPIVATSLSSDPRRRTCGENSGLNPDCT